MKSVLALAFVLTTAVSLSAKAQTATGCDVDVREVSAALLETTKELDELRSQGFVAVEDVSCMRGVTGFKTYTITYSDVASNRRAELSFGMNLRPGRDEKDPLVYSKRISY